MQDFGHYSNESFESRMKLQGYMIYVMSEKAFSVGRVALKVRLFSVVVRSSVSHSRTNQ